MTNTICLWQKKQKWKNALLSMYTICFSAASNATVSTSLDLEMKKFRGAERKGTPHAMEIIDSAEAMRVDGNYASRLAFDLARQCQESNKLSLGFFKL